MGAAVEEAALDADTALTMKLSGAENSAGPASRRRDNIGAPAGPAAAAHNDTRGERARAVSDCRRVSKQHRQKPGRTQLAF